MSVTLISICAVGCVVGPGPKKSGDEVEVGFCSGRSSSLARLSQDLIATDKEGNVSAYDPGDLCWVMMCSALVWLMSESTFRARLARRRPEGRARRPHKRAEQISTTAARHLCRAHVMVSWVFRVAGGRYAAGVVPSQLSEGPRLG